MWFDPSREKRRRAERSLFGEGRSNRLRVRTRVSLASNAKFRWFGGILMLLVSLLALTVMAWAGAQYLGGYLFRQNDLFRIRNFKIECDGEIVTSKHVMDYAGLSGAGNLFALNIARKRDFLLHTVPRLKAVKISRRLPGELVIEVQERVSVARLDMGGYYLSVDREGYVLGKAADVSHLPVISGHGLPGLRPGSRLAGTPVMNALEVFDVCENTQVRNLCKVLRIDVRNREALELMLADGERVMLAWTNMGTGDALGRDRLEQKLLKLAEIIKAAAARGKRVASLDMTLENNFPAPEYY